MSWVGKKGKRKERFIDLSKREEEVLEALRNRSVKVTARVLGIKQITVRSHVARVRKKVKDCRRFLRVVRSHRGVLKKD